MFPNNPRWRHRRHRPCPRKCLRLSIWRTSRSRLSWSTCCPRTQIVHPSTHPSSSWNSDSRSCRHFPPSPQTRRAMWSCFPCSLNCVPMPSFSFTPPTSPLVAVQVVWLTPYSYDSPCRPHQCCARPTLCRTSTATSISPAPATKMPAPTPSSQSTIIYACFISP